MSYSQDKGQLTRCQIVELCRTRKTLAAISAEMNITRDRISNHTRRLEDEGWLKVIKGNGWANSYETIREDKYPEPSDFVDAVPVMKDKPIPGARVFNFDILEKKHPDYFKQPLRKMEFRGIGS